MKYCPITYQALKENEYYSQKGLKQLSPKLKVLHPLPLTAEAQREEAIARVGKMSLQGVQLKLSAKLHIKEGIFKIVDKKGDYILKPQSQLYPELPENEAITMTLAKTLGIEVPTHGLLYAADESFTYFIKRFDRFGKSKKTPVEDFAQLSHHTRETKYNSSMEKVAKCIQEYCSFPAIELIKLFRLIIFNFLIGNEDMHLKNFSLISKDNLIKLSPAYDLLNSTIAQRKASEELALPLHGKKKGLTKKDFLSYFAIEQLSLNQKIIDKELDQFKKIIPVWKALLDISFLSSDMKKRYLALLDERTKRFDF